MLARSSHHPYPPARTLPPTHTAQVELKQRFEAAVRENSDFCRFQGDLSEKALIARLLKDPGLE